MIHRLLQRLSLWPVHRVLCVALLVALTVLLLPSVARADQWHAGPPFSDEIVPAVFPAPPQGAAESPVLPASSDPDSFGYTSAPTAINWIDASGGTDTGLTGNIGGDKVGPIALPFPFKFYEYTYTSIYIEGSAYLFFGEPPTNPGGGCTGIPWPDAENNRIVPFLFSWSWPTVGPDSHVYYASGGAAPNRFFVVEWYQVQVNQKTYTFEAVLFENGDIVFQYLSMMDDQWYVCNMAGIENATGEDGLSSANGATPQSNTAIRYTRPAPSGRVEIRPKEQGQFTIPGGTTQFQVTLRNIGDLGSDVFYLGSTMDWPLSLFKADGTTPLPDTDGDRFPDTGPVAPGATVTITARIAAPQAAGVGSSANTMLVANSSLSRGKSAWVVLASAIPAPFVQAYSNYADGAMSLDMMQRRVQASANATAPGVSGRDMAVIETTDGNFLYGWTKGGKSVVDEIQYVLVDDVGNAIGPVRKIPNDGLATSPIRDATPAFAAEAGGRIGVVWVRTAWNAAMDSRLVNIYFAVLDSQGNVTVAPTNVTNNTDWFTPGHNDNIAWFNSPRITATQNGRFVLAWSREWWVNCCWNDRTEVYYSVRGRLGGEILPPTRVVTDAAGAGVHVGRYPSLTTLQDNTILLAYYLSNPSSNVWYLVLNSSGGVVRSPVLLAHDSYHVEGLDSAQLSNGAIVISWTRWEYPRKYVAYTMLTSSFTQMVLPRDVSVSGEGGATSVTTDDQAHAILTWSDDVNLRYALLNGDGAIATGEMIYSSPVQGALTTAWQGQGNASYRAGARLRAAVDSAGGFVRPGDSMTYQIGVQNMGRPLTDTFEVTVASGWNVGLYRADGVTPLADTDGDGTVDTGGVFPGDTVTVTVKLQVPGAASAGDYAATALTVTSSVNLLKGWTKTLQNAVPAPFAQAFRDASDNAMSLLLTQPGFRKQVQPAVFRPNSFEGAVAEAANGNFVYAWDTMRCFDAACSSSISEIEYTVVDRHGDTVLPARKLVDHGTPAVLVADFVPAVAAAPDGRVAVVWWRIVVNPTMGWLELSIWLAILDSSGNVLVPATDLTHNTASGIQRGQYAPRVTVTGDNRIVVATALASLRGQLSPRVTVTGDNRIVVAWASPDLGSAGLNQDVYYTVRTTSGDEIAPVTKATSDTIGASDGFGAPALAALAGNRVLLAWARYGDFGDVYASVLDSSGSVVHGATNLSSDATVWRDDNPDAVRLSDDKVIVTWTATAGAGSRIRFAILDESYAVLAGPTVLYQRDGVSAGYQVSAAADAEGHAIVTWPDDDVAGRSSLYYALVASNGAVSTPPMPFYSSHDRSSELETNTVGYGNTSYSWRPDSGVDMQAWFKGQTVFGSANGPVALSIAFRNTGMLTATGVVLTATLHPSLTYLSDTSGVVPVLSGSEAVWSLPDVAFFQEAGFDLRVQVPDLPFRTSLPVTITVNAAEPEANPSDNSDVGEILVAYWQYLPVILSQR